MSSSLWPHELQHARLPPPSLSPRICLKSCPLSQWCHPTISSSVTPSSPFPKSFPVSGSLPMSHLFASDGQSIGASASALSMNIQSWFLLRSTGLISLLSKGLLQVSPAPQFESVNSWTLSLLVWLKVLRERMIWSQKWLISNTQNCLVLLPLYFFICFISPLHFLFHCRIFFLIVFRRRDIKSLL